MLRPTGQNQPYAMPAAWRPAPPPTAPYAAPRPMGPWVRPGPYMPYGTATTPKGWKELLVGAGAHAAIAAGVCAGIGALIGGAPGAVWGAVIGQGLAQGFLQLLARMADGSGDQGPLIVGIPAAPAGAGVLIAHVAFGATAATCAWGLILVPAAVAGLALLWHPAGT